ncbi:GFA family protein [Wenxinia marina]|uniref:CENP-V/GFA domain-containing protein n=1 Tax=Wenxinia marina DSM 24838 TaxID=1123501 RepID=A0A0D0Q9S7_9RHOB|nr:hypothetical protein [Wenxinia marina]KIQ71174.1 hypothetical protein Wenmar_00553 [Wenxinia marina DSM 24838]GGL54269.1 aldehyde-activating protein [Wenxinia marina]
MSATSGSDIEGRCLCGACGWTYRGRPDHATSCNCGACRRYGALWAYGWIDEEIALTGVSRPHVRPIEDSGLAFHHCPTCGCLMHWTGLSPHEDGRTRAAVNLRMATDPAAVRGVRVRLFDGADSWTAPEGLPERTVGDYWL